MEIKKRFTYLRYHITMKGVSKSANGKKLVSQLYQVWLIIDIKGKKSKQKKFLF